jgi:hypothetical protein
MFLEKNVFIMKMITPIEGAWQGVYLLRLHYEERAVPPQHKRAQVLQSRLRVI